MPTLYLASTSPARRQILHDIGLSATVLTPDVDEEAVVAEMVGDQSASAVALHLAKLKAQSVLGPNIDGIVIGGDSVFEYAGTNYGKPLTPEVATERWKMMRGKSGTLYSGLWLIDHSGGVHHGSNGLVSHATVHFSDTISDQEIDAYVATGEPLNVAGAFTLDGRGAAFIDHVEGDPYAVIGMSATALRTLIHSLGHAYHQFWSARS
jgi:septum formation protein